MENEMDLEKGGDSRTLKLLIGLTLFFVIVGLCGYIGLNIGVFETNQEILECRDIWFNSSRYFGERITVKAQWRGWAPCMIGDTIHGGILSVDLSNLKVKFYPFQLVRDEWYYFTGVLKSNPDQHEWQWLLEVTEIQPVE